jgi:hypothetical protein
MAPDLLALTLLICLGQLRVVVVMIVVVLMIVIMVVVMVVGLAHSRDSVPALRT